MNDLKIKMIEKDTVISAFGNQLEKIEHKLRKQEEDNIALKLKIESFDIQKKPEAEFKCPHCDFIANSNHGLKVHKKRKHTKQTNKV